MQRNVIDFLYLSEEDMIDAGVLDIKSCVETMEETFGLLGKGDFVMSGYNHSSHGSLLWFPEQSEFSNMPLAGPDRRYMAMPSYLGGRFNICGTKWYGSNIDNPNKGFPRSILMFCLNDPETGAPLAIMSANLLSAMRTGAVPGVATKYLANSNAKSVGIIGCGVINKACTKSILLNMPEVEDIYLFDINRSKAESFSKEIINFCGLDIHVMGTLKECVMVSDVLSVATSGPSNVEIDKSWFKPGSLITVSGHVVLEDSCYIENRIVFDHWEMHKTWLNEGKLHPNGIRSISDWVPTFDILKLFDDNVISEDELLSLGDIVAENVEFKRDENDIILFFSGGLPIEDAAWAYVMYSNAKNRNIGQKLSLWKEPTWK